MIGTCLLQKTLPLIHAMGAEKIGYVLDSPALPPQWQSSPEQRIRLLEHNGFSLERETCRFEWKGHNDQFDKSNEIVFRTLSEVGDATFIEAIMRVSESTLDRSINQDREQNGDKLQAQTMFTELQQMDYDPAWWQLAFTLNEELIGIVMPTKNPTYATIGYIGVVPEQRGRGYIDILLHQATSLLTDAGESMIRADTDVENTPMIHAFKRAGYIQFAKRCEYNRDLSAL
jgi:RimJ/RimL family protein N-acetyltransferase